MKYKYIHPNLYVLLYYCRWVLDVFLGGSFRTYGREFLHYFEPEEAEGELRKDHADPSDLFFPKVMNNERAFRYRPSSQ